MAQDTSKYYRTVTGRMESLLPQIQDMMAGKAGQVEQEAGLEEEVPTEDTMEGGELSGPTYADRRLQAAESALKNQRNLREPIG